MHNLRGVSIDTVALIVGTGICLLKGPSTGNRDAVVLQPLSKMLAIKKYDIQ
jgi:hypothetical protein